MSNFFKLLRMRSLTRPKIYNTNVIIELSPNSRKRFDFFEEMPQIKFKFDYVICYRTAAQNIWI